MIRLANRRNQPPPPSRISSSRSRRGRSTQKIPRRSVVLILLLISDLLWRCRLGRRAAARVAASRLGWTEITGAIPHTLGSPAFWPSGGCSSNVESANRLKRFSRTLLIIDTFPLSRRKSADTRPIPRGSACTYTLSRKLFDPASGSRAPRRAGVGYNVVVAGQTTPADLRRLVEKLAEAVRRTKQGWTAG